MLFLVLGDVLQSEPFRGSLRVLGGLIDITQILMSNAIREDWCQQLAAMTCSWLKLLCDTYRDFVLKPKFHYMVHYATEIKKHGPVRKFSSIRFEAKHNELKSLLMASKNRVNVCKTMASKHQLKVGVGYNSEGCDANKPKISKARAPHDDVLSCVNYWFDVCQNEAVFCDRVEYDGTTYSGGDVLVVKNDENSGLALVRYVLIHSDKIRFVFICSKLKIIKEDSDLKAYEVSVEEGAVCHDHDSLLDHQPLGMYSVRGRRFVVLRSKLQRPLQ